MSDKVLDINNLNENQKINYVKNLFFKHDINQALDTLLKNEKKDLSIIKTILVSIDDEIILNRLKEQCNLSDSSSVKSFVYSRVLAILSFYKKNVILNKFLKMLDDEVIKQIAFYEYQNKTDVSFNNKIFNKYCSKYKEEALNTFKLDEEEVLMLDEEKERYNALSSKKLKKSSKKKIVYSLIIVFVLLIAGVLGYKYYDYNKLVSKYNGLILPGIYLNDIDLTGVNLKDLGNIIEREKQRIKSGSIIIYNVNKELKFTYDNLKITINDKGLLDEIKNYNKDLSLIKKVKLIEENKKSKTFYLDASFDEKVADELVLELEEEFNTAPRNDGIIVDNNHNVYYDKGAIGFTLNVKKTKSKITKALSNLKTEVKIEAEGSVVPNEVKYESLSSINKKVSTHTTYFVNAGNRGHNISLASKRLNNTIIMPGETFSYLKVVGPYGASNGYLPAPIYLNSEVSTANGGGVCQLASTLYMAQLKAGLQTVARRNHTFAPNYVPKGLDATVYSTTTDYKFKNNYNYPIYITSYVNGNYLTVDIWTNDAALGGKTFEPYSVYSNGAYLSYLKTIENGKVIETKYLGRSVYKTMQ